MTDQLSTTKNSLRRRLRGRRDRHAECDRTEIDGSMLNTLVSLPEFERARTIFVYIGNVSKGEFNTAPLIDLLHDAGIRVAVPFVVSDGSKRDPCMEAHRLEPDTLLQTRRWGLSEPVGALNVPPDAIDTVIVPALGISLTGQRIGNGLGFYDRFLKQTRATRICICYEDCIVPPFATEPHDQRMDLLISERRVVRVV